MTHKITVRLALALVMATSATSVTAQQTPAKPANQVETNQTTSELRPLDVAAFAELQRVTTSYELRAGETLRQALTRWAADSGWQIIWQSSKDYRIEASMVFPRGTDFREAARSTARSIWAVNPTFKLKAYRNNVMVLEEVQG